jgi:phosphoadenosine phosphosulfate reductase
MAKQRNAPPPQHPLAVIEAAKAAGIREVIVSHSMGKDSLVAMDLCFEHFDRVEAFFMYLTPGLSFQEHTIADTERRYGIKVLRLPDKRLCDQLRYANLRDMTEQTAKLPAITYRQVAHNARKHFGINWIASGEQSGESLSRQGMIRGCGKIADDAEVPEWLERDKSFNGIDIRRGYIYPLGFWRPQDVQSYLSQKRIPLPYEYSILGTGASFGGIRMEHLGPISEQLPEDFAKIKRLFPHVEAELLRWKIEQDREQQAAAVKAASKVTQRELNESHKVSEV